jgi:adenosylhomocysteine nucleosidase
MLKAINTVAVSAPENGMPVPVVARMLGFTTMMYAIVTNVVTPPATSEVSDCGRGVVMGGRDATIAFGMQKRAYRLSLVGILPVALVCGACSAASSSTPPRPLVVQGAMDAEIRKLVAAIEKPIEERVGGWTFWVGTLDGAPVVISKTMKGMENAAAATTIAAERYHPSAIINQGTAGGHQPDLHVFDIVLGVEAVNLGAFKTPFRDRHAGSESQQWSPLDLLKSEGSAGTDPQALTMRRLHADEELLAMARSVRTSYTKGRVVDGVIGSADVWNSELDRIAQFHDRFGTSVEEMETASAAQIAAAFRIPFLGIRVLSNNVTNGDTYERGAGEACQDFVREVIRAYFVRANR